MPNRPEEGNNKRCRCGQDKDALPSGHPYPYPINCGKGANNACTNGVKKVEQARAKAEAAATLLAGTAVHPVTAAPNPLNASAASNVVGPSARQNQAARQPLQATTSIMPRGLGELNVDISLLHAYQQTIMAAGSGVREPALEKLATFMTLADPASEGKIDGNKKSIWGIVDAETKDAYKEAMLEVDRYLHCPDDPSEQEIRRTRLKAYCADVLAKERDFEPSVHRNKPLHDKNRKGRDRHTEQFEAFYAAPVSNQTVGSGAALDDILGDIRNRDISSAGNYSAIAGPGLLPAYEADWARELGADVQHRRDAYIQEGKMAAFMTETFKNGLKEKETPTVAGVKEMGTDDEDLGYLNMGEEDDGDHLIAIYEQALEQAQNAYKAGH